MTYEKSHTWSVSDSRKLVGSLGKKNEPSNQPLLEIYLPSICRGRINKVLITLPLAWSGTFVLFYFPDPRNYFFYCEVAISRSEF